MKDAMRKLDCALLLLWLGLLLTPSLAGQDDKKKSAQKQRPDLSGRWRLEVIENVGGKTRQPAKETVMVIQYQEPVIKFREDVGSESERELSYYTDGRGEENPSGWSTSINGSGPSRDPAQLKELLKSKTKWDGEKLVSRAFLQRIVSGHRVSMDIVKEWKLSKDGQTLTVTTRTTPPPETSTPRQGVMVSSMTNEVKHKYRLETKASTQ